MQVIIVTGLSGAGKTQAMNCLEDQGYYCIDNMPPALIVNFMNLSYAAKENIDKVAFAMDIRGGEFFDGLTDALKVLRERKADVKIIYLEAEDEVLMQRFSESRRVHPKTRASVTKKDLARERELLASVRDKADFVIDTSHMKSAQLKKELLALSAESKPEETFVINLFSFGYKHGAPEQADMIFDMRFLPNPYYVRGLKKLSGNNRKVKDYVLKQEEATEFIDNLEQLLKDVFPGYMREGKWHLNIAFGCTGGHHRSVVMANDFYDRLKKQGYQVTLLHRDIKK